MLVFFLDSDSVEADIRNLPRDEKSHERGIAVSFLERLCAFAWDLHPLRNYGDDVQIEENWRQRRPQFVRVLAGLHQLSQLERGSTESLDEACCEMLKRIALGTKLYLPVEPHWGEKQRLPKTLEEALAGRSDAAKVLILHAVRKKEEERFAQLRELAHQQHVVTEEMQRLSSHRIM